MENFEKMMNQGPYSNYSCTGWCNLRHSNRDQFKETVHFLCRAVSCYGSGTFTRSIIVVPGYKYLVATVTCVIACCAMTRNILQRIKQKAAAEGIDRGLQRVVSGIPDEVQDVDLVLDDLNRTGQR